MRRQALPFYQSKNFKIMLPFTKDKGTTFLVNSQIKIKALLLSQSNAFFVVNKIFRIIAE
jgi:hypothetical protein